MNPARLLLLLADARLARAENELVRAAALAGLPDVQLVRELEAGAAALVAARERMRVLLFPGTPAEPGRLQ